MPAACSWRRPRTEEACGRRWNGGGGAEREALIRVAEGKGGAVLLKGPGLGWTKRAAPEVNEGIIFKEI